MDTNRIWGTDIELFAVPTMLQAPIYTYTQFHYSREYRWSRYHFLAQPSQVVCDYVPSIRKLVHMTKLPNYHLDLLHLNGNHYDLIVSNQEDSNWLNCPFYQNLSSVDVISSPKIYYNIINKQENLNFGYQKLYILRTEFIYIIIIIIIYNYYSMYVCMYVYSRGRSRGES